MVLKILDAFAGIGGFSYAAERLVGGYKTKQFIEIDEYCQSVLKKNFPNIPIHDDIKTFKAKRGEYDLLTAGFPCQDLSVAGQQRGIGEGTRSGLFYEVIRLIREIRPKFVLLENVRNLLSHKGGETFQEVLFQIAKAGYDAEWSVISAKDVGACHRRERVWIIAYPNSEYEDRAESTVQAGRETIIGDATSDTQSERAREYEHRLRGQSEGRNLQGDRDSDKKISITTNSNGVLGFDLLRQQSEQGKEELERSSDRNGRSATKYKWEPQESRLNPYWKGYISQPTLRRGDDGLSNRVLRLKSLGNSIVPACAAVPLQRIKRLSQIVGEGTMGRTYIK